MITMNNFTDKDEQTFLNACAALNVEPKVMTETLKAKQRGEGAHLLDALWLRSLGDVTSLRRLRFQCRNIGQMIAEHEISEMIEYLEESETKNRQQPPNARPVISKFVTT